MHMDFEQEWSNGIPENYDPGEAIPQFKQHLYENWKRGDGPCRGCPNRVMKKGCEPAFGSGSAEAEILLVGTSPGARDKDREIDNKSRVVNSDRLEEEDGFDGHPLCTFYDRTITDLESWSGLKKLRPNFIEEGLNSSISSGRFYFTNAKKCCNIDNRDNDSAVRRCQEYLSKEIELVDPRIILAWGPQAAKGCAGALDYDPTKLPQGATSLPQGEIQPTGSVIGYRDTDPYLITMPHWSFLGSNCHHIPDFEPDEYDHPERQLYSELAELVKYLLER